MKFKIEELATERRIDGYSTIKVTSLETGLTFSISVPSYLLSNVDEVKKILSRRHDEIIKSNVSVSCEIKVGNII